MSDRIRDFIRPFMVSGKELELYDEHGNVEVAVVTNEGVRHYHQFEELLDGQVVSDLDIDSFAELLPNMEKLSITSRHSSDGPWDNNVHDASKYPNLRELELDFFSQPLTQSFLRNAKTLRKLSLTGAHSFIYEVQSSQKEPIIPRHIANLHFDGEYEDDGIIVELLRVSDPARKTITFSEPMPFLDANEDVMDMIKEITGKYKWKKVEPTLKAVGRVTKLIEDALPSIGSMQWAHAMGDFYGSSGRTPFETKEGCLEGHFRDEKNNLKLYTRQQLLFIAKGMGLEPEADDAKEKFNRLSKGALCDLLIK